MRLADAVGKGEITGTGAKSPQEASKHVDKLQNDVREVRDFLDRLGKARGKKDRDQLLQDFDKAIRRLRGHLTEVGQKWLQTVRPRSGSDIKPAVPAETK